VLAPFDDDNLIPVFGFGESTTTDRSVFPFFADRPCRGFGEVLSRYRELCPRVVMSGPTNYAPAIEAAIQVRPQGEGGGGGAVHCMRRPVLPAGGGADQGVPHPGAGGRWGEGVAGGCEVQLVEGGRWAAARYNEFGAQPGHPADGTHLLFAQTGK
jgi:hypothetical protein